LQNLKAKPSVLTVLILYAIGYCSLLQSLSKELNKNFLKKLPFILYVEASFSGSTFFSVGEGDGGDSCGKLRVW